jgi:tetratricopeptide (TPR) repeat protein
VAGFYGRISEVRKLLRQAPAGVAGFEVLFGNDPQAETAAQEALRLNLSNGGAAWTLAVAGKPEGLRILEQLQKDFPQDTFLHFITIPSATAALEIHAGKGAKAIELLHDATPFEPGSNSLPAIYIRGRAYLQTKSGREAAAQFQKILDHRGVDPLSPLYPLSHLGLGRAYALAGDLPKARKSYQDFLAIWKDADPDIPILIQAKQEYTKLTTN